MDLVSALTVAGPLLALLCGVVVLEGGGGLPFPPIPVLFCLLWVAGGAGLIFVCIRTLERADSPFVKIFRDAVRVFRGNLGLVLIVFYLLAVVASCAAGAAWACREMLPRYERMIIDGHFLRAQAYLISPIVIGSVLGACLMVGANAVLAEYFISWIAGKPESVLFAMCRVALRFWRILEFTLLWSLFLALLFCIKAEADQWLRKRFAFLDLMFTFLYWAVEFGLVMAAYFMLVVMVRERVGAWTAFLVTLEITREELGNEVGELARIKALDGAVAVGAGGVFLSGFSAVSFGVMLRDQTKAGPDPHLVMAALVAVPIGASVLLVVTYYVLFQTLQLFLAAAVYLYLKDGRAAPGFEARDFDHVLGLRACGIGTIPRLREILGLSGEAPVSAGF